METRNLFKLTTVDPTMSELSICYPRIVSIFKENVTLDTASYQNVVTLCLSSGAPWLHPAGAPTLWTPLSCLQNRQGAEQSWLL